MSRRLDPDPQHVIFTLRRSIFIWFCGGVIGWAAAILLVYNLFQTNDKQIVETKPAAPAEISSERPADVTADEAHSLNKIAPAAGSDSSKAGDKADQSTAAPASQ